MAPPSLPALFSFCRSSASRGRGGPPEVDEKQFLLTTKVFPNEKRLFIEMVTTLGIQFEIKRKIRATQGHGWL